MARIAISNSSPLIVLQKVGQLQLLDALFDEVCVSRTVACEVGDIPATIAVKDFENTYLFHALCRDMDPGEASAITLATEVSGAVLVLDDYRGRRGAQKLGLPLTGTVGLILLAKAEGHLREIRPCIQDLQQAGLYLSPALIQTILEAAGEASSPTPSP